MNLDQQKADIRAKCIEANPLLATPFQYRDVDGGLMETERTLRLTDVLLATKEAWGRRPFSSGTFLQLDRWHLDIIKGWDWYADDLEQQSDETI